MAAACKADFENEQPADNIDHSSLGRRLLELEQRLDEYDRQKAQERDRMEACKEIQCWIKEARAAVASVLQIRFPTVYRELDAYRVTLEQHEVDFAAWLHYRLPLDPLQLEILEETWNIVNRLFRMEPHIWKQISGRIYEKHIAKLHQRTVSIERAVQLVDLLSDESDATKSALRTMIRKLASMSAA